MFGEQPLHRAFAAVLGEVPLDARDVRVAVAGHRLAEAGQAVLGGRDSGGAADHDHPTATPPVEVVGGEAGSVAVREIHVADRDRARRPGEQHCGQADFDQSGGQRVVRVGGDEDRAVGAALLEVADHLVPRLGGVGDHQQGVQSARTQCADHAAEGAAEERVGEDAVPGLVRALDGAADTGEHQGDRTGPAGDE